MDNKNKPIKFPHNFKFEKISYGLKVKATGGEFFPNKYIFSFIIPTIGILFIAWGVTLYFLGTKYASIIDSSKELTIYTGIFLTFPLSFPALFYFLLNLTNTKVEYLFSPGGLKIKYRADDFFSNNIFGIANNQYKIIIIIFLLFFAFIGLKIIKYKFVSILQFIYHYFSHIGTVQYIIQIVLFLVVIIYFFRIILLDINAEYLFSPAGITITSIKGLFFIPYNDIKGIYMDKEALSSSSNETVVYYKISLEFKKEIYFKYLNKNKIKSNLFITKDKKVAFYLLQKIKESVNFS